MKYANDTVIIHTGNPNENNSYWALRAFLSHAAAVQHTRIETSWLATSCPTCWIANWYLSHQWTTTWMFLTLYRGSAILSDNMIYLLPETSRTATHVVSRVCELFARQSNWQWLISGQCQPPHWANSPKSGVQKVLIPQRCFRYFLGVLVMKMGGCVSWFAVFLSASGVAVWAEETRSVFVNRFRHFRSTCLLPSE